MDLDRDTIDDRPLPAAPEPESHGGIEAILEAVGYDVRAAIDLGTGLVTALPGATLEPLRDPGTAVGQALGRRAAYGGEAWVLCHCGDAGWISGQALNGFHAANVHKAPVTFIMHRNGIQLSGTTRKMTGVDPRPIIEARGSELNQVWTSLIDNAIDAMQGNGTLWLVTRNENDYVMVEVADSGSGIPADMLPHIFEPFFTTRQSAGNGLGLSLSRTMVLSQGGAISVESESGVGTTFTVHLPAYEAPLPSLPLEPRASPTGPVRVLVIDDEPSLRKVCQRLVVSMGHQCSVAETSATAVAMAVLDDHDPLVDRSPDPILYG